MRKVPKGAQGHNLVVALNMSGTAHTEHFDVGSKGGSVLESNYSAAGTKVDLDRVELPAFGAVVIAVE